MTNARYPCATEPNCGVEHINGPPGNETLQVVAHIKDHADRYIELVRKLRDQYAVTGVTLKAISRGEMTEVKMKEAVTIYRGLLAYLGLTEQEIP